MLAIGRALMTNPKLLILDEATEGLAPIIRTQIWDCLATLKAEGQSILIIDKNVKAIARLADHHYILDKGRVVWDGDSKDIAGDRRIDRTLSWGLIPITAGTLDWILTWTLLSVTPLERPLAALVVRYHRCGLMIWQRM